MTKIWKIVFAVAILAIIVLGYIVYKDSSSGLTFGAVGVKLAENYDPYIRYNGGYFSALPIETSGGVQTGLSGTLVNRLNTGTCYIQTYSATIAASTTAQVDCQATTATGGITTANDTALTGISFGDSVVPSLASSTASGGASAGAAPVFGGLDLLGASASTTSGYITLLIFNATGKTYTWPTTGTATGTASYFVSH